MIDTHKLKQKTVLVFDFGSQVAVAQRLSRDFGRVLYYIPSVTNGFKDHKAHGIGRGIEGIERVDDWWEHYYQIDLFVFTDIYMGGLQHFLRMQGKAVFGGGKASEMESNRLQFLQLVESMGLPVLKYEVAKGVDDLDKKLKNKTDKYIKSSLRGDFETTHFINYVLFQTELNRLKHDMGVYAEEETYLICDPIDAIGEIGYDGYVIDGQYPKESCCGIEIKDAGYIGKIMPYSSLPKQVKMVNEKFADVFRSYGYRAAFSTEVRIDSKKDGYFIDPTLRFPEPNTALTLEMYTNYSQIIYEVALGIVPEIEYRYKWGCELIMKSELAKTEPIAIEFPKKYADNVKLKNLVIDKDGVHWVTPNNVEMAEIGAVVAMGDSMEEAIKNAIKIAETVKGHDLKIGTDCMEDAKKQIANLTKHGIRFI